MDRLKETTIEYLEAHQYRVFYDGSLVKLITDYNVMLKTFTQKNAYDELNDMSEILGFSILKTLNINTLNIYYVDGCEIDLAFSFTFDRYFKHVKTFKDYFTIEHISEVNGRFHSKAKFIFKDKPEHTINYTFTVNGDLIETECDGERLIFYNEYRYCVKTNTLIRHMSNYNIFRYNHLYGNFFDVFSSQTIRMPVNTVSYELVPEIPMSEPTNQPTGDSFLTMTIQKPRTNKHNCVGEFYTG